MPVYFFHLQSKKGGDCFMLKFNINTEEKITKTEKHKKIAITFEKKSQKLITYIFKLIQSFL